MSKSLGLDDISKSKQTRVWKPKRVRQNWTSIVLTCRALLLTFALKHERQTEPRRQAHVHVKFAGQSSAEFRKDFIEMSIDAMLEVSVYIR